MTGMLTQLVLNFGSLLLYHTQLGRAKAADDTSGSDRFNVAHDVSRDAWIAALALFAALRGSIRIASCSRAFRSKRLLRSQASVAEGSRAALIWATFRRRPRHDAREFLLRC